LGYEDEDSFGRMAMQKKGCRVIAVTSWVFLRKRAAKCICLAEKGLQNAEKGCKMLQNGDA
jgi:hypothetical protein